MANNDDFLHCCCGYSYANHSIQRKFSGGYKNYSLYSVAGKFWQTAEAAVFPSINHNIHQKFPVDTITFIGIVAIWIF